MKKLFGIQTILYVFLAQNPIIFSARYWIAAELLTLDFISIIAYVITKITFIKYAEPTSTTTISKYPKSFFTTPSSKH